MLQVISFACSEYGWGYSHVCEDVPIIALMLLMRQKIHSSSNGKDGFTLMQQEELEANANVPWEELVRRNREKLAKDMALYN